MTASFQQDTSLTLALVYSLHVIFWFFCLIWYHRSKTLSIWNPLSLYHIFHFVVFILRPLLVHFFEFTDILQLLQHPISERDHIIALTAIDLALAVFQFTILREVSTLQATPNELLPPVPLFIATRAIVWTFCLLGPAALYSLVYGNYDVMVRDEVSGLMIFGAGGSGYIADAKLMFLSLGILATIIYKIRWFSVLPLVVFVGHFLIFASHRWPLIVATQAIFLVIAYYHGSKKALRFAGTAIVLALPIFYVKGEDRDFFRNQMRGGSERINQLLDSKNLKLAERFDRMDFAHYDFVCLYVATHPRATGGFTWYTQWLQLLTEPIPRALWPEKPLGSPVKMFDVEMMEIANWTGISPTIVGSGWMSLGICGVALNAFFSAFLLGKIYRRFQKRRGNMLTASGYILFLSVVPLYYRDGDISIFKFCLWILAPWILFRGIVSLLLPQYHPGVMRTMPTIQR